VWRSNNDELSAVEKELLELLRRKFHDEEKSHADKVQLILRDFRQT